MTDKPEIVSAASCNLCGHLLVDNQHGIDQNDLRINATGDVKHIGRCTYCKDCNPRLRDALTKAHEGRRDD